MQTLELALEPKQEKLGCKVEQCAREFKTLKYGPKQLKENATNELLEVSGEYDSISSIMNTCDFLIKQLKSPYRWIPEIATHEDIIRGNNYVIFKPVIIANYTHQLFSKGDIRIFFSGTIGSKDHFCRYLGLSPKETMLISKDLNFPVTNRPIYLDYAGNMSGTNNQTGEPNWKNPLALAKINYLVNSHGLENGVIHTASTEQAKWIAQKVDVDHEMFLVKSKTRKKEKNRENIIQDFKESEESSILIGAGIKDGVDLPDDECRWQILSKVPYARWYGQVKERGAKDNEWFNYNAIIKILQAYGRGVRHSNDYCKFYIIDAKFQDLLDNYPHLFNYSFFEAIQ